MNVEILEFTLTAAINAIAEGKNVLLLSWNITGECSSHNITKFAIWELKKELQRSLLPVNEVDRILIAVGREE